MLFVGTKIPRHIKNMKEKTHSETASSSFPQIVKTQHAADCRRRHVPSGRPAASRRPDIAKIHRYRYTKYSSTHTSPFPADAFK